MKSSDTSLDNEQRKVVSAWLTTKESSNLLSDIIVMFNYQDVEIANHVLNLLVQTLLKVTHQGACAKAAEALETVSKYLANSKNKKLNVLPSQHLKRLFEQHLQQNDLRMNLRRSAGLASATKALAKSSSKTCTYAFEMLIQNSRQASNAATHVRVHALNLLNVFLRDSHVFVSQSNLSKLFQISVIGFQHEKWALRNSSLLVYSATMSKMFKDQTREVLPLGDFMARYPELLSFLENRISVLLKTMKNRNHMCMMPMLVLLSRLIPDREGELSIDQECRSKMTKMLWCLIKSSHASTRVVSARSFCAFVSELDLIRVASRAIESMVQKVSHIHQNTIHGVLVLTSRLLRVARQTVSTSRLKLSDLTRALSDLCCLKGMFEMMTGMSLSALFSLLCEICDSIENDERKIIGSKIARNVFSWVRMNTTFSTTTSVGISNALEHATKLLWILADDENIHRDRLVNLLCTSSEVNDVFFRTSSEILINNDSSRLSEENVEMLTRFLWTSLTRSASFKETLYLSSQIELLSFLSKRHRPKVDDMNLLHKVSKRSRQFSSRNAVLLLLSINIQSDDTANAMLRPVVSEWIEMLDQNSRDEAALELRLGVLDSIEVSLCSLQNLFDRAEHDATVGDILVRIWKILHRLLVDDDGIVRRRMAILTSRLMKLRFSKCPLLCAKLLLRRVCKIVGSSNQMLLSTLKEWFFAGLSSCVLRFSRESETRLFEGEPLNENLEMLWHVRAAKSFLRDAPDVVRNEIRGEMETYKKHVLTDLIRESNDGADITIRGDNFCALYALRSDFSGVDLTDSSSSDWIRFMVFGDGE